MTVVPNVKDYIGLSPQDIRPLDWKEFKPFFEHGASQKFIYKPVTAIDRANVEFNPPLSALLQSHVDDFNYKQIINTLG